MARVVLRPLAATDVDVDEIWDYIAEDSSEQSDAWVDRLDAKLRVLATQPMMGRAREELAPGLRSLAFGRYVIFYLPLADGVDVVRMCTRPGISMRCSAKTPSLTHSSRHSLGWQLHQVFVASPPTTPSSPPSPARRGIGYEKRR